MKKLSLLLVAILYLSVIVYAGEVITNDTGEDATGLRVSFSTPVLITAFGDILTSVDPQMLSYEFVFSGGVVEPWGSHWFNYAPATASIMEAEWLTGAITPGVAAGDLTRDDLLNLGRAPTYEEIMAAIAEYPGPDEPLYEPAEDESIWLTDLEGHADIYDNDSIKINYADWFDKSQVIKIEVYRNGIKMLFLPDMLDVLTNDQMKTFDGNPAEHTPASSHTDHAIWGYEYRFRFTTDSSSIGTEPAIRVRSPIQLSWDFAFTNLFFWWEPLEQESFGESLLVQRLQEIRDEGWNGISLDYWLFLDSQYPSQLIRYHEGCDLEEVTACLKTPTEDDLQIILRAAEAVGLQVELRLHMFVTLEYKRTHPECKAGCRSQIQPPDVDSFFGSYESECIRVAQILEEGGADVFTVLVEANSLEAYASHVEHLFETLSSHFSGRIGVSSSTNGVPMAYLEGEIGSMAEWLDDAEFWDWQASDGRTPDIYMNANCPPPMFEDQDDQRLSVMVERQVELWKDVVQFYRDAYPRNRLGFGEFSTLNVDGMAGRYEHESMEGFSSRQHDWQEEADAIAAMVIASEALGVDGISYLYGYLLADFRYFYPSIAPHVAHAEAPTRRLLPEMLGGKYEGLLIHHLGEGANPIAGEVGEAGTEQNEQDPNHHVLQYGSEDINPSLEWHLENEALGKPTRTVAIVVRAKGKADTALPVLVVTANGQTLVEFEALTFDTWRDYAFEVELPASLTVFSVGMASPQRGNQVSIDRVSINGERHEMESLPEYGLIGATPELDPTYISWWNPGRIAWVIDLSE